MKGDGRKVEERKQIYDQEGNEKFAIQLRKLRKQAKLTQAQLSFETGLTQSHISLLENGESNPSISVICVLARAMEIDPDEFLKFKLTPKHDDER